MLLVALLTWVAVQSARPATELLFWAPQFARLSACDADNSSAPAGAVQAAAAPDLFFAPALATVLPPERPPAPFRILWLELDGCRPGHRQRIDRPPRALS